VDERDLIIERDALLDEQDIHARCLQAVSEFCILMAISEVLVMGIKYRQDIGIKEGLKNDRKRARMAAAWWWLCVCRSCPRARDER
jgi:hypothetical protein